MSEKAKKPVWEDVDSSMIAAFKYDEEAQTLAVMFNNNGAIHVCGCAAGCGGGFAEGGLEGELYALCDYWDV